MNPPTATPRTDDTPYQATPSADLRQQIMDSRVPKNEREWWAQRTIEKLETELSAARSDIAHYLRDNLTAHQMACAAGLERDQLRAEVSEARRAWLGDDYGHLPLIEALEKFRSDSDAESDRADVLYQRSCEVEHKLRAEVERLKATLSAIEEDGTSEHNAAVGLRQNLVAAITRAEKAEDALAEWSVLNLWGGTPEIIHEFIKGQQNRIHHCQDLGAECLEQARLLGMSGEREADLLGKISRLHSINENILVFAFRYALGRKTTAPGIVADVLIERWNDLKPHTQIQVQREIGSAMAMGEAGSSIDLDTWQAVLALPVKP